MLSLLVLLSCAAALFGRRTRYFGSVMAVLCALLFLWSWPPMAALLTHSLERPFPAGALPAGESEVIVVLAGGAYTHDASVPEDLATQGTYLRASHAAWLYRNWRQLPVLACGGPSDERVPTSKLMASVLAGSGVPSSMIWQEAESKTTYQNAVNAARLLQAKGIRRIALVTEGWHMLRAEQCFRQAGLQVSPAGCCYRTLQFHGTWQEFLPTPRAIQYNEDTLHEWAGLLSYYASGKLKPGR